MSLPRVLIVALLGVASTGAAFGQQAAATIVPQAPGGLSIAFDAPHGQLTATGFALKATPMTANSTRTTGTIEVALSINLVSKFRKGTTFPCAILVLGGQLDAANQKVDGGMETASGLASVNAANPSTATCMLSIPYAWTFQNDATASTGLVLAFAVAGLTPQGVTQRSTVQVTGVDALPASGATTTFAFDAAL
jgi:hypothetical protein